MPRDVKRNPRTHAHHNLARKPCRYAVQSANEIRAQGPALPPRNRPPRGLPQDLVPRIRRILADLDAAVGPADLDVPGYRMHPLKGTLADYWRVRVSGNLRIVFRAGDGEPVDVDLIDYN